MLQWRHECTDRTCSDGLHRHPNKSSNISSNKLCIYSKSINLNPINWIHDSRIPDPMGRFCVDFCSSVSILHELSKHHRLCSIWQFDTQTNRPDLRIWTIFFRIHDFWHQEPRIHRNQSTIGSQLLHTFKPTHRKMHHTDQ
jgi:hypothetical protein